MCLFRGSNQYVPGITFLMPALFEDGFWYRYQLPLSGSKSAYTRID